MLIISSRKWRLDGTVCTIHLALTRVSAKQFENLALGTLQTARAGLQRQFEESLHEAFGPNLDVGEVSLNSQACEILVKIEANSYVVKNSANLERALTRFVCYVEDVLNESMADKLGRAMFRGRWFPAPALIRLQSEPPERYVPIMRKVQQPLIMLMLGTILGSALIPWIQLRSNIERIRHEERTKIALDIIDQNKTTNSKLVGLRTALELFAKDHRNPQPATEIAKQQKDMLLWFNAQYLAFNEQAWWWYWSVQMKAQLSALATPAEAKKMRVLAGQYQEQLGKCTKDLREPWQKLLRDKYDNKNWESTMKLLQKVQSDLDQHNRERDAIALQMSQIFASK